MTKIGLFFLLLLQLSFIKAQDTYTFDTRFLYKLNYNPDSSDRSIFREEYFMLLANESLSLFQSSNKFYLDSILQSDYSKGNTLGDMASASKYSTKFKYTILKENRNITYYEFDRDFSPDLVYYKEYDNMDWQLVDTTLIINDLTCQLATVNYGGRVWNAWFCNEIPIQDGPYKFGNLPGLIVKLYDSEKSWNFDLVEIDPNLAVTVNVNKYPAKKLTMMEKNDFIQQKESLSKNRLLINESKGRIKINDAESRKNMARNYSKFLQANSNKIEILP
ncbi:GLPGLI family protein [Sphingobacterium chungjuense]|uniref:GLPGLI family protein n=1 Tax=Sphingobacterium chungjuense TaxID=2675553 RepID=UPI00140ABFF4|nr:GLPGLI family protein [Sphingobacterium chungjuense]